MDPITGLAYGRISVGALSFLFPSLTARLFLLDPRSNPQLGYMGRMFGSREIALGAITLASSGEARRRLVQLGIAVDGADAFTGLATAATGSVPKKAGLLLTVVAAAAVATGVLELQDS
ncbi:hypothetical protein [Marmoricola sp. URHB0036]|uniref:hypothetical protein n=1 Tax=Marmoricola sp. URHB0036 TaxID=1298863 RepID=UPI0004274AC3|nr:hypothetical protein [Marmoricola sp. URHB0036]